MQLISGLIVNLKKILLLFLKLLFHSFHLSVLEKELEEAKDIFGDSDEGARGIKSFN